MLTSLLGIAPQPEPDGSFRPSKLALKLATSDVSAFRRVSYDSYQGTRSKILVLLTEQKNMRMKNGKQFSTGNHPVETLVPMLHLRDAGFEFEIVTPTGKPAVFEMWAMPQQDKEVMGLYEELKPSLEQPQPLQGVLDRFLASVEQYAAVFVPGGHGAMLGLPEDTNVGQLLRWVQENDVFTISLCHGPGGLLATSLDGNPFAYSGYKMCVFPDSVDKMTPKIGYMPGHMPWRLQEKLESLGAEVVNKKGDSTCHVDRRLITGASPEAADALGRLAAETLLAQLT